MSTTSIQCPHCRGQFPLTETLAQPLLEAERTAQAANHKQLLTNLRQKEADLSVRQRQLDEAKNSFDQDLAGKVAAAVATARADIEQQAKSHVALELQLLNESLAGTNKALQKAQAEELGLRRQQQELEQKQREFELTMQRQLDSERQRIRGEALQTANEANRFKLAEKDQVIEEVRKQLDEARRASEKTSQQLQGDVLEADLAQILGRAFPRDEILRTQKGQNGADIVQRVLGTRGQDCGKILWEGKRTKNWSDTWLPKLRDDQRDEGADLAILVSTVLPAGVLHFTERDGVWITSPQFAEHLAGALRQQLERVAQARAAMTGQHAKAGLLYAYLTGPEFRQRMQGITETFTEMQYDLESEKRVAIQRWSKRAKQLDRMLKNTLGLYGDVQGISGASMPELTEPTLLTIPNTVDQDHSANPAA